MRHPNNYGTLYSGTLRVLGCHSWIRLKRFFFFSEPPKRKDVHFLSLIQLWWNCIKRKDRSFCRTVELMTEGRIKGVCYLTSLSRWHVQHVKQEAKLTGQAKFTMAQVILHANSQRLDKIKQLGGNKTEREVRVTYTGTNTLNSSIFISQFCISLW